LPLSRRVCCCISRFDILVGSIYHAAAPAALGRYGAHGKNLNLLAFPARDNALSTRRTIQYGQPVQEKERKLFCKQQ
jgi:hypothetical protein